MSMPKIKVLGPTVTAGEAVTDRQTDGQTDGNVGNIYGLIPESPLLGHYNNKAFSLNIIIMLSMSSVMEKCV